MNTFGQRLKYAKEKKGLSNSELATMMGKSSPSTVVSWEQDKSEVTISQLKKLAEILEVSEDFLLNGNDISKVKEAPPEYMLVKKDDYIALQEKVIQNQEQELKKAQKQIQQLKNIEGVSNSK